MKQEYYLEEMVDTDNDGLDDRLIDGDHEAENVQDVISRINNIHIQNLPVSFLWRIKDSLETERIMLLDKAIALEKEAHAHLFKGDYHILSQTRKSLRTLKKQQDEVVEKENQIWSYIQESIMNTKIESIIGKKMYRVFNWILMIFTFLVLGLMLVDLQNPPNATHFLNSWNIFLIDTFCCIFFLAEFFLKYRCADDKKWFWKRHWVDLLTSIPIPPADASRIIRLGRVLRILRLLRVLRLFRFLRFLRMLLFISKSVDRMHDLLDVKTMKRSLKWALFVIILGAVGISKLEGMNNNSVHDFGGSLWWSFSTVITGGYADLYNPNSVMGQVLTIIMVLSGMILIGVFTATLTSMYVGEDSSEIERGNEEILKRMQNLEEQLTELKSRTQTDSSQST